MIGIPEYVKSTACLGFICNNNIPDAIPQSLGFGGIKTSLFSS